MIATLIILLFILWLLRYGPFVDALAFPLLAINGRVIDFWDVATFLLVIWVVGILPSPFRQIGAVLVILWTLSVLGILVVANLSSIIVLAIIVGLILYLLSGDTTVREV